MPVDYQRLMGWPVPETREAVTDTLVILYALGCGAGEAADDLPFVWEERLKVLPTMASVLAHPGLWMADPGLGIDWRRLLHGEQGIRIHGPLPTSGTVTGTTRIVDAIDRGPGKGLLIYQEREIRDGAGRHVATATITTFARGDGGAGGPQKRAPRPFALPDRPPDGRVELATRPDIHLLYRLMGDRHPIHVDPDFAKGEGFDGPIMAGLCTYGIAGRALLKAANVAPERLVAMDARFSAPAYPGETIATDVWEMDGGVLGYRCTTLPRGVTVIDNGRAEIAPA